ncbi:hypothetical protein NPIL_347801 [Nephila pilipes]|uniref:Uncharacterized protein n=1 Tax=Nephila pilipes TaxID=299642 RepID=A0A8X6N602_NEPPI|nr:hypothetical protein NPIL_347801 [Nephila pilipes]
MTIPSIQSQVLHSYGSIFSRQTISRRLAEGVCSYETSVTNDSSECLIPLLSFLQWCLQRQTWNPDSVWEPTMVGSSKVTAVKSGQQ